MWTFIFLFGILILVGAAFFFVKRIERFAFFQKLFPEKTVDDNESEKKDMSESDDISETSNHKNLKKKRTISLKRVVSFAIVFVVAAVLGFTMNTVNMAICMFHLLAIWLIFDGIFALIKKARKTDFKRYYAGGLAIVFTFAYMTMGWYYAHHVYRTDLLVESSKGVQKLRIAQITDSHVGATFHAKELFQYITEINETTPDILVVTGDFVDDDTTKEDMIESCRALGTAKTKYGVYFVFGNHDKGYYASQRGYSGDELRQELIDNNVIVLEDEAMLVDNRFYVIGRQDSSTVRNRKSMSELLQDLDISKYMVVLDHEPQDYDAQTEAKVDLVLSGHTHGGQFFPVNKLGEWTKINDFTYGEEKRDASTFFVSSGIADWSLKFKTGCISEYVIVDVVGK